MRGEYESRNEEIGQIIEELFHVESEADFEHICKEFDEIYLDGNGEVREDFRHEYTNISGKIRELIEYEEDGIKPFVLQNLVDNIGYIYDYAVFHEKKYIKNLFKLKDHVGLEAGRIELVEQLRWDITNSKQSVAVQLDDLHELADSLEEQINESTDLIRTFEHQSEKSERKLNELGSKSDDIATKMEDAQRDSITILGIFASIVLSFTAGVGFSSSVLENFHVGSPYRIAAVIVALGFVLTNIISILLMYIDKIKSVTEKKMKYPSFVIILNALYGILLIMDFVAFKCKWLE